MNWLLAIFLATGVVQAAETLRISVVVDPNSSDAKAMTLKSKDGDRQVWVSNKTIVSEKEVENASASVSQLRTIDVKLTEKGKAAMIAATTPMTPSVDRMAIIIEGQLHSAPVVQSVPLGGSFVINGFTEYDDRQFTNLVRAISGKQPLGPEEAIPVNPPPGPRPPERKVVPYTEKELIAMKEQRERMGIYQLDRLPDEAELNKTLKRGMTAAEVIALYGKPSRHDQKPDSKDFYFEYQIAPERRPDKVAAGGNPESFQVKFRDGTVTSWSINSWTTAPRIMKAEGQVEGVLKVVFPKIDLSAEDVNFVTWIEGIRIPDLDQPVMSTDLLSLLSLIHSSIHPITDNKKDTFQTDCDVLKLLAKYLPDFAKLTASAKDGKIPLSELFETVKPYCNGEKSIPDLPAPSHK